MSRQRRGRSDRYSRTNFFMSQHIVQHIVRIIVPCFLVGAAISGCASVYQLPPAPAVGADDPRAVQPERPSVATHAGTVAPGYVEIESGIERDANADHIYAEQAPTLLKFGVTSRVQLAVLVPIARATGVKAGIGDVNVGVKWRVLEHHPFWSDIALLPSVTFSTGGARGSGSTAASLLLINSRTFGPVSVDLNVGRTWRTGDGATVPGTSTFWTAATSAPVRGPIGWELECFGYPGTGGAAGSVPIVAILTGPTWLVHRALSLDVGMIAPIVGPQPRAVYVGITTNLGRLLF